MPQMILPHHLGTCLLPILKSMALMRIQRPVKQQMPLWRRKELIGLSTITPSLLGERLANQHYTSLTLCIVVRY